ncbi:hypothetical protein KXW28_009155 [Aspergillus fumigatus]|nr:hypothetical protein KXX48_008708 [Aspergillus fumigatus]KAH1359022.1 hypothetical protein KXX63_008201 [Aspergillus fumigatus]KAH1683842.1 hypothetical protein KXX46_008742 [Aspergillus fumigatus]KAH2867052.1 hypothetical protein KXW36_008019 [Aspergillus fumigatus]KAH3095144.1 hypothetical protein KXW28_009155 [Aspergillus fumigatus]
MFDFLVDNVADYVQSKQLSLLLCRDDINKVVLGDFDPEDEELFKCFVTSHIELRLNELRRRRDLPQTTATDTEDLGKATDTQTREYQAMHVRKRARVERHYIQEEHGRHIQYMYSKAPTERVALLGDLLSEAVQSSRQWQMERSLEETTTDCITTLVPKNPSQDISITLWVGQEAGLRMNDVFRLVPKWTSSPSHVGP